MYKVTIEIDPVEYEYVSEIVSQAFELSLTPARVHVDEVKEP